MKLAVILILLLSSCFNFLLEYLNYKNRNAPIPDNVKDIYDEETYKKRSAYDMENLRLGIISGICGVLLSAAFLIFNVHSQLFDYICGYTANAYLQAFFMLGVPALLGLALSTAFGAVDTFKIEAKYGFNRSSVKTFIADTIKNLIIGVVVFGGLLSFFIFLYDTIGYTGLAIFFVTLGALVFVLAAISPYINRIFYKFTPLEDGSLKEKINALAERNGYPLKKVYVVNASKRTTKLNAFFSGMGKTKTVGLFDTLVEKLDEDEVVAVLAHEIGHSKRKHIQRRIPFTVLQFVPLIIILFLLIGYEPISLAFGFSGLNIAFGLNICIGLISPVLIILRIPGSIVSRKHEFEADSFEVENAGMGPAVSAMKRIARENFNNLTPHPFVVYATHSHPTVSNRIHAMERSGTAQVAV